MLNDENLYDKLLKLDGRDYKAYKSIEGDYKFPEFILIINYVQGDPFAAPSKVFVKVPQSIARFPLSLYKSPSRQIALRDYLNRQFAKIAQKLATHRGTGKSGSIDIVTAKQEILPRTAIFVSERQVEARFWVGLPARGRIILGRQAAQMLCKNIPDIVDRALKYKAIDSQIIQNYVEIAEDADWLRQKLENKGLVAFVANGAILPRRSRVDLRPLQKGAIPFQSPKSLEVEFNCPNYGIIRGMGIPQGITLIVGGGYHGKSTLLRAVELGVYNHIPGDGREFVVTNQEAVKIRSEDRRSIAGVNISPFINQLPQGRSTENFSTTNASGSTSQAANIIEALEAGASILLMDEDTAATNFMIRDRRMQQLISKDKEPITPFIDKVRQLYTDYGVSTILVMGGSGDYFDVADKVIAMKNFQPLDVTNQAKIIAQQHPNDRLIEGADEFGRISPRIPLLESIEPSRGKQAVTVKVRDVEHVVFGTENIDLGAVEQIVEAGQLLAIATAILYSKKKYFDCCRTLPEILDQVITDIANQGLDILTEFPRGDLVLFRRFELAATLNRLRSLTVKDCL